MSAQELLEAALALTLEERAELTERLAASLTPVTSFSKEEWEAAWRTEVDRRLAAVDAGETELIDDDEVWADAERLLDSISG